MTFPKWMNDALASDLNTIIEAREAAARAEYTRATDAVRDFLIRTGYPPYLDPTEDEAAQRRKGGNR